MISILRPWSLPVVLALAAVPAPLAAWTPASQLAIAADAARLGPADLYRQIARHPEEFRRGALSAFEDREPSHHMKNGTGDGELDRVVLAEGQRAVELVRSHRPFAEIVFQLGRLAHYVADADNPLNAARSDPDEARYFRDYLLYVESAESRFAVVFYGLDPDLDRRGGLGRLVERTLARGRALYPAVGREYQRIGFASGRLAFDDRSTAFAIAALTYSHAVTDVASVFRWAWLAAGGSDPRPGLPAVGGELLVLRRELRGQ